MRRSPQRAPGWTQRLPTPGRATAPHSPTAHASVVQDPDRARSYSGGRQLGINLWRKSQECNKAPACASRGISIPGINGKTRIPMFQQGSHKVQVSDGADLRRKGRLQPGRGGRPGWGWNSAWGVHRGPCPQPRSWQALERKECQWEKVRTCDRRSRRDQEGEEGAERAPLASSLLREETARRTQRSPQ